MRDNYLRLRSVAERWPWLTAVGALGLVLPFLRGIAPLSLFTGLLVFALPGLAFGAALTPRRALRRWETIPIALGSSMAIVIVTGLLLHLTPIGLDPTVWPMTLSGITVLAAGIAIVRRGQIGLPAATARPNEAGPRRWPAAAWQIFTAATIVTILLVSTRVLGSQPQTEFTQFWMLPGTEFGSVEVGVSNREADPAVYALSISVRGREVQSLEFAVDAGATLVQTIRLTSPTNAQIRAELFLLPNRSRPYRTTTIWDLATRTVPSVMP